jgi:hypothetical protein
MTLTGPVDILGVLIIILVVVAIIYFVRRV